MSTLSKAAARKIADEFVTSDWANTLVRALAQASLASLENAGFSLEPGDLRVNVEVRTDHLFLSAEGDGHDALCHQVLTVSAVLSVPALPRSLGEVGCFVCVGQRGPGSGPAIASQACANAEADPDLRLAADVTAAATEHVRQAFEAVDAEHIKACAQQLSAQLLSALAP